MVYHHQTVYHHVRVINKANFPSGDTEDDDCDDAGGEGGAVEVTNVSNLEEAEVSAMMHVLPQHVMKEGEIATMAVHDSATGKMKKHVIRKVSGMYRLKVKLSWFF